MKTRIKIEFYRQWNEYHVKVQQYNCNRWNTIDALTYYTDDKEDAEGTKRAMLVELKLKHPEWDFTEED